MMQQTEIPFKEDAIIVNFSGQPRWENDSFSHEFGTEKFDSYLTMEGCKISWASDEYTDEENKAIGGWLSVYDNWSLAEKQICDEAMDNYKNAF